MGRQRSAQSIEAERMYIKGEKISDIAAKLNVPEGTVRRWKSTQKWKPPKAKKTNEKNEQKKPNKGGAPLGNLNAVGNNGGAPKGNRNALKHGGYANIYWDSISEEEKELAETMPSDPELLLIDQIRVLTIRERRFMLRIKELEDGPKHRISTVFRSEEKRDFKDAEEKALYDGIQENKISDGKKLPGQPYHLSTTSEASHDIVQRLEEALTRCQAQKQRCLQDLVKLQSEKGDDKKYSTAAAWVKAIMEVEDNAE